MRIALAALLCLLATAADAQSTQAPARDPGYEPLQNLVGTWTNRGSESVLVETCEWFDGRLHVVCNTQRTRDDGTVGRSMSILSYVPGSGYVYTGIGSKGRYETQHGGSWADGVLVFIMPSSQDGKTTLTRTRMGPFGGPTVPFVVDTSTDGSRWTVVGTVDYIRLK